MTTLITGLSAADVEPESGDIRLLLGGTIGQKPYAVQLMRGMVPTLVTTLMGLMRLSREKYKDKAEFQPLTITEARKVTMPDGRLGLVLTVEHAIPIAILMEKTDVEGLQKILAELKELISEPAKPRTQH